MGVYNGRMARAEARGTKRHIASRCGPSIVNGTSGVGGR
jgi:hypothetical protein